MQDNPLISVVIPVYNVEEYLSECVDSVINQTYKNLDIILVDDGSPDNCPAICDDYAGKDSRVRVIHRKNGGPGVSRNCGIKAARGEYIGFIDSDDYVSPVYFEQLYTTLITSGAGIAQCVHSTMGNDIDDRISTKFRLYSAHDAIRFALGCKDVERAAWGKLCNISFFQEKGVRYPEGQTAEDFYVMPRLFDIAGSLALSDSIKYFYRLRKDSLLLKPFAADKLDYFISLSNAEEYLASRYPDLLKYARWDDIRNSLFILGRALQSEPEDSPIVAQIFRHIKEGDIFGFMFCDYSLKSKIAALVTRFIPKLGFKLLKLV